MHSLKLTPIFLEFLNKIIGFINKKRGVASIYDANLSQEYVEKLQAFNNKVYAH